MAAILLLQLYILLLPVVSGKNLFVYDYDDRQVKQTKYKNLFEYLIYITFINHFFSVYLTVD